ncbi:hypothetical protein V8G54_033085 [Vigna mungo]|uniref:Uncharacterized protein n=1 Tax=Vigna mungo TaxID=3915 RepID=A0AAQ3MMT9_VIGMU
MSDGLNNGSSTFGRVTALEDAGADEDAIAAKLHHEGGIGRSGDATCCEVDDGKAAKLLGLHDKVVGRGDVLGEGENFVVVHVAENPNVAHHRADVTHGLDDVAGACLALGADHGGALADAAEGFPEVAAAADKGDAEVVLVDVVSVIGQRENLALVHVVDADGLQDLGLHEVPDAGLCHNGDGNGPLDFLDELWVAHAGHTTLGPDVGGYPLEGHDRAGPGLFGDAGLVGVDNIHDDTAPEHLGEADFDGEGGLLGFRDGTVAIDGNHTGSFSFH